MGALDDIRGGAPSWRGTAQKMVRQVGQRHGVGARIRQTKRGQEVAIRGDLRSALGAAAEIDGGDVNLVMMRMGAEGYEDTL